MQFAFHDFHPPAGDLLGEVLHGLACQPKRLSPKFFYDRRGSQLFDAITRLPEYYPTRTEIDILKRYAPEIARQVGTGSLLVEPGGGSCAKVHILLEGLQRMRSGMQVVAKDAPAEPAAGG